jgi:hypothetical protein
MGTVRRETMGLTTELIDLYLRPLPREGLYRYRFRADQQRARSLLVRGKGRVMMAVSTTISWLRMSDPWRGKRHAQSAAIMKLAAALNVHPRELEADDEA